MGSQLQSSSEMLSREQLLHLFDRFSFLTSQPDVNKRIADGVEDKQEAVAITTAIQEEIFLEMGIDPRFGISSLGKVNEKYENDQDMMIRFYKFIAREEMACDEAELEANEFAERMHSQEKLQEQQLEMLKHMRKFPLDDQSAILEKEGECNPNLRFKEQQSQCILNNILFRGIVHTAAFSRWKMPILTVLHQFCLQSRFKRLFGGGCLLYLSQGRLEHVSVMQCSLFSDWYSVQALYVAGICCSNCSLYVDWISVVK
ncbi:uncharacterized protein Pyn_35403 [Prunus yedoensis var. nudiflora]|uniref:Uncharacterized protein n=1 Tax=Prunus yedoensis var. nudiflora TaxID=2094558 RepID=A0A314YYQ1_PRUYE|nr:uncharacterized protein Pyn_35403 [Prunus yedoensis var. nudiflora]